MSANRIIWIDVIKCVAIQSRLDFIFDYNNLKFIKK